MPVLELSSLGESSAELPSLGQPPSAKSSPEQSDMLRRFARGDLDAFETLFRRHWADVYRWIVAIVRDPSLAEDLTTETFWRIYRAHARFDPARSFAERIAKLLKKSHPRVTDDGTRLGRDLWPAMLQRLQQPAAPVAWFEQAWFNQAWFDWALGAAVVAWLAFFPAAIPVLLYHL